MGYVRSEPLPIFNPRDQASGVSEPESEPGVGLRARFQVGRDFSGTNLEIPVGKAAASAQKEDGRRDQDDGQPREAAGFPCAAREV